jgi:hypothetical protein
MRRLLSVHRFRLVIAASVAAIALMIAVLHAAIGIAVHWKAA